MSDLTGHFSGNSDKKRTVISVAPINPKTIFCIFKGAGTLSHVRSF